MIPAAFDYQRAESLEHALGLLAEHGDGAKLLAGGHSLLPLMKLRLAVPEVLVDLARLRELSFVRRDGDRLVLGALTRHRDIEVSPLVREAAPLLAHVAGRIGDPQVRHRGTIGGSLAHGDPASDLPAALLALGGSVIATGPGGEREIEGEDLFTGFLETSLAPGEILTEVRIPVAQAGWSFQKFNRRAQDWAIVGVAAVAGAGAEARVALVNMGPVPLRAGAVERALGAGSDLTSAAELADEGLEPPADLNASPEYRRHLARVLVRRALSEALERASAS